ncbi:class I SAM-dependent methyltransferase [Ferruginibacter yonginensis]|uniref:Class I SAM-dependent methyltransferase n=1 Tax=Ferruginibacter yonginensis TaxID=1310416 RepID=A0ABV8QS28_9BACT
MNDREKNIDTYFTNIRLTNATLDVYLPRTSILKAIKEQMPFFKGILLDVGCGIMPYRELILNENKQVSKYIGLDLATSTIHKTDIADLHWDAVTIPLQEHTIDVVMATEVLEHSFEPDQTLNEIYRVLKPNGQFFFTVPFIWPLHEVPYDAYRYTPFSLKKHLEKAGFKNIEIRSLGGWHASLAQMIGLWITENKFTGFKKKMVTKIAKRIIRYLVKIDIPDHSFKQHTITSGLYGTAQKL